MNQRTRIRLDQLFTAATGASILLLLLVLIAVLGPMVYRGSSAVFFRGTVEFRKMQRDLFERGGGTALEAEIAQTEEFRRHVYEMIDEFKKGMDVEGMSSQVREIYRQFGQELRRKDVPAQQYTELRELTRGIRDKLEAAFQSQDVDEISRTVNEVLQYANDPQLKDTPAAKLFEIARQFLQAAQRTDLAKHHEYAAAFQEVEQILFHSDDLPGLLGPRPDEPLRLLVMLRYGATRWDQAQKLLDRLLWVEQWVQTEQGQSLQMQRKPRAELFPEPFRPLFSYVEQNAERMLNPKITVYWQYFKDDNANSHYFGGIGPEILGTMLITVIGMLFVIPLGIISAAYLVECASDGWVIRIIRMGINTLAGVPSIVFGLFGLGFFVLFLFPLLGFEPKPCILAASMTLAVLTLPVMIRASEEAIRAVPQAYKEGSMALGASRLHTFVTVILPAALPGILTGVILSLSRIAGETAPILFTGAVSLGAVPHSIFDPTRTLSYGSYDMAVGDRLAMMVPHNQYGMVVALIGLILVLNGITIVLRGRVFRKLRGQ